MEIRGFHRHLLPTSPSSAVSQIDRLATHVLHQDAQPPVEGNGRRYGKYAHSLRRVSYMAGGWRWFFVNQQQYENFSHAFLLDKFRKYLQIDFEFIGEKRSLQFTFSICREQQFTLILQTHVFPAIHAPQTWCHGSCQLGGWTFLEKVSCLCSWKWEACHPLKAPLKFQVSKRCVQPVDSHWGLTCFGHHLLTSFSTGGDSTYPIGKRYAICPYIYMYTIHSIMNYDF